MHTHNNVRHLHASSMLDTHTSCKQNSCKDTLQFYNNITMTKCLDIQGPFTIQSHGLALNTMHSPVLQQHHHDQMLRHSRTPHHALSTRPHSFPCKDSLSFPCKDSLSMQHSRLGKLKTMQGHSSCKQRLANKLTIQFSRKSHSHPHANLYR